MIDQEKITNLKTLIHESETILIIVSPQANFDQASSASSLYLALKALNKDVSLLSPKVSSFPQITAWDEVKTSIGKQNLLVSFDYDPVAVDKVSYSIGEENKKFYLTIKPQKGHPPLDTSKVQFTYTGAEADLIILIGVHELESLAQLYDGYEDLYQSTTIVTIHKFEPEELGSIKLDISASSCMSEALAQLWESLGLGFDADIATNLLAAIETVTHGFRSLTATAETFTQVAKLLTQGAKRVKREAVNNDLNKTAHDTGKNKSSEMTKFKDQQEVTINPAATQATKQATAKASAASKIVKKFVNKHHRHQDNAAKYDPEPSGFRA